MRERKTIDTHKGEFIGVYVPGGLKTLLRKRAAGEHRTLSQELNRLLTIAEFGEPLSWAEVERRTAPEQREEAA